MYHTLPISITGRSLFHLFIAWPHIPFLHPPLNFMAQLKAVEGDRWGGDKDDDNDRDSGDDDGDEHGGGSSRGRSRTRRGPANTGNAHVGSSKRGRSSKGKDRGSEGDKRDGGGGKRKRRRRDDDDDDESHVNIKPKHKPEQKHKGSSNVPKAVGEEAKIVGAATACLGKKVLDT